MSDRYQRLRDAFSDHKVVPQSNFHLPPGVTIKGSENGYASMYAPDDTPARRLILDVRGREVTVTQFSDDKDVVMVGVGGSTGSLDMINISDVSDFLASL
jgi:hypothetical protein